MVVSLLIIAIVVSVLAISSRPNNFVWGDSYERKEQMSYQEEASYDLM